MSLPAPRASGTLRAVRRRLLVVFAFTLLVVFAPPARADGSRPIHERRLANGLRVVVCPDPAGTDVSLVVRYDVGSRDEPTYLERARTSLLSDWRTRVATTQGLATMAAAALAQDVPLDEIARYPARVQAMTRDDVRRVARQYLADEALRVVVVGPAGSIAELQALGLGAVVQRDGWGGPWAP